MRIGLIVEGQSEFVALPHLLHQLREGTGHSFIGPVRATAHPNAQAAVIARSVVESVAYLQLRKVDEVVLLMDREDREECPGALADQLSEHIQPLVTVPVRVVIKDRTFENWLISDVEALRAMPARFTITEATVRSISPNKADRINAYELLQQCAIRNSFQKVKDAQRILGHADIHRMAENSRSFRRLLRCVGHPAYAGQSRNPA